MHKLVLFIKTYKSDFEPFKKLINSIEKFNHDNIPVYISINDSDFIFFQKNIKGNYTLLKDSDIYTCTIKDGWRYQQVIKSQFHKLNVCENYLCIDSDSEFIKKFYYHDFLYDQSTPYTIMHEGKGFLETMTRINFDLDAVSFKSGVEAIRTLFGVHCSKFWDFGPSPYLWSTKVWKHFHNVYLKSRNQNMEDFFIDIEKISLPSEGTIYGEYLRMTKLIEIIPVEGFFKVYHYKKQYKLERKYHKIEKIRQVYLGVIFQSNWKKSFLDRFFFRN